MPAWSRANYRARMPMITEEALAVAIQRAKQMAAVGYRLCADPECRFCEGLPARKRSSQHRQSTPDWVPLVSPRADKREHQVEQTRALAAAVVEPFRTREEFFLYIARGLGMTTANGGRNACAKAGVTANVETPQGRPA